jgi:hypothetical protein
MPSFVENVDAVVKSVGASNVGLVWGLSNVRWQSAEDRDAFLTEISARG